MGVSFQRLLTDARQLMARMWSNETASGHVAVSCPHCSAIDELDQYTILSGGLVRPQWQCMAPGCSFLDYIELEAHGEDS